jgi:hypothetical protein
MLPMPPQWRDLLEELAPAFARRSTHRLFAALVVKLPCCPSPAALPVLFRLWHGQGTVSQPELAARLLKVLAGAFPGRAVHGTGDCAFHGNPWSSRGQRG